MFTFAPVNRNRYESIHKVMTSLYILLSIIISIRLYPTVGSEKVCVHV